MAFQWAAVRKQMRGVCGLEVSRRGCLGKRLRSPVLAVCGHPSHSTLEAFKSQSWCPGFGFQIFSDLHVLGSLHKV